MPDTISNFLEALTRTEMFPFSLSEMEGFPESEYSSLLRKYTEAEAWYSGEKLEETKTRDGKEIEVYPIKINPIKSAVQKHAFALFGEVDEDDQPLVSPKVVFSTDEEKELSAQAEQVLNQVWWESNGRALQFTNGALSQIYGGCVFKITYDPHDTLRSIPVRIEAPHPKYFIGLPDSTDMFRLREAWIVKPITIEEARENGYNETAAAYSPENPWLIEKWTNREYKAWVNEQEVRRMMTDGTWEPVSGANPYGFVPIVYIPHVRVDGFYGENMFDTVKGVIQEINLRMADFGDAISVDAHAYLGMRNISGSPKLVRLAPGINGISIGSTPGMTGPENKPDIWELRKASASDAMARMIDLLYDQFRRDAFIPKVADGEDEGSQRSGLTLAMRMLSLLWHVFIERTFWTSGLNLLNRMILRMLVIKESESTGMTIRHAALRIKQDWSPILPRDREMLVNEAVSRVGAMISSPQTAFELLGDIQDEDQEISQIIEFAKKLSEARSIGAPQQAKPKTKKVAADAPTESQANSSE